jgi:membrane protein
MIPAALAVLYRLEQSRRAPQWKWISVKCASATVIWLIGSAALSYYVANYGTYDATYGSLGAAIGLMIWMWMSTIRRLLCAELHSEIEYRTKQNTTAGSATKPLGQRGAEMADTVGGDHDTLDRRRSPHLVGRVKMTGDLARHILAVDR